MALPRKSIFLGNLKSEWRDIPFYSPPPSPFLPFPAPVFRRTRLFQESELEDDYDSKSINKENCSIESEDDVVYPKGTKLVLITLALSLTIFLTGLDSSIIATAIPKIASQFNSLDDIAWYGSAYMLTDASFQLLFGKIYTYFSIKYTFLSAVTLFEIGSLICAIAPNSVVLIFGRALAGLGDAGIFSGALIIVAYTVPLQRRPAYAGLIGASFAVAAVAGPVLGGLFTDQLSWRWCFYINLPIGAAAVLVIILFFESPQQVNVGHLSFKDKCARLDPFGTIVFVPGIICLLLALQWGGTKHPWGSPSIVMLFVSFVVLVGAFIGIQIWKQEFATVPPRITKIPTVYTAMIYAGCLGSAFIIFTFYLPVWFQAIQGVSATQSGIRGLPMVSGVIVMSMISGAGVTFFGYYTPFMIAGSICMTIAAMFMSIFTPATTSASWIGLPCLFGIGVGLAMQQSILAVQTVLDLDDVATGSALITFAQTLGSAVFIGIGETVFMNKLLENLAELVPTLNPAIVLITGATNLKSHLPPQFVPGVLLSYNNALVKCFFAAVVMSSLSIFVAVCMDWKNVKDAKPGARKLELIA